MQYEKKPGWAGGNSTLAQGDYNWNAKARVEDVQEDETSWLVEINYT